MPTERLQEKVTRRKNLALHRVRQTSESVGQNKIQRGHQVLTDFTSNDYLGLKKHPKIIETLVHACERYGLGSGSSSFISGYSTAHQDTEEEFAQWLGTERTVLFNSGYAANIGVISALTQRSDTIFSDKLCHASLLDGIALSRAKHIRYQHNNLKHLESMAKTHPPHLMVTESVFSMEGDIAPIANLAKLANTYQAGLMIDDAHGIGILGQSGRGAIEHFMLDKSNYTCLIVPLGKAFNAMGAFVAGSKPTIEAILQFSRSYCYSTAIPPAVCLALQTTLNIIQEETWRRQKLLENIQFFMDYASYKNLPIISSDCAPIKSVLTYSSKHTLHLQQWLLSKGFCVSGIRPPTVPKHQARLRLSLNCLHTQEQITLLIDHIAEGLRVC